jgi:hypothetical protein
VVQRVVVVHRGREDRDLGGGDAHALPEGLADAGRNCRRRRLAAAAAHHGIDVPS